MIIKQLVMKNFGKFAYKDISFKDGMNIVYGVNESGKSTVHSFIRGMLFGMDKKRGRASKDDIYERYRTWEGSTVFSGYMQIDDEGKSYELSRIINDKERQLQCVDLKSGRDCIIGEKPEFIGDITENRYRNTISNEQTKSRVDKDLAAELKNYITNMSTSKDKEVDVSNALKELNNKKREINKKNTIDEIKEVSVKVEKDKEAEEELDKLIRQARQVRNECNQELSEKEEESIRVIKEYVDEYDSIYGLYTELKELEDEKKIASSIEESVEKSSKYLSQYTFTIIVSIFVCICIYLSFAKSGPGFESIFSSVLIIAIASGILFFFNETITNKIMQYKCKKSLKQEKNDREKKESINRTILEKENAILEYAKRICPLTEVNEEEMLRLEKEVMILKNRVEGHIYQKQQKEIEKKVALEKYNWQIEKIENDNESRVSRKKQLEELNRVYKNDKLDVDALNIAMDTISELSKNIHYSVSGELNELISKYCNLLTWGKYSRVRVDNEFNITVFDNDRYIDIEKLSVGTTHQIYLAVRLAVSELFWPNRQLPILLDESFAFYDDNRLKATLKALASMVNRQIILFTCHQREAEILEEEGIEYNYVEL